MGGGGGQKFMLHFHVRVFVCLQNHNPGGCPEEGREYTDDRG